MAIRETNRALETEGPELKSQMSFLSCMTLKSELVSPNLQSYKMGIIILQSCWEGSTRNSHEQWAMSHWATASVQQMVVVTNVERLPCTNTACRKQKKTLFMQGRHYYSPFSLYHSPQSYKLLCNQASNHPSLSWDCSLSQHLCKVLWATGPGVRNGANLLYEYPLDPKPDRPSLEGWVFARRWAAWPRLSEVAAFSQHKLDGWHRASNPNSPSRGYFHDCWLGLVSHLSVATTTSHCAPTAGQRQSARREGWENHPWPRCEAPIPKGIFERPSGMEIRLMEFKGRETTSGWGSLSVATKEAI